MTSGPSDVPIRSFQDVLDQAYKVVAVDGWAAHMTLQTSAVGSAMNKVFYNNEMEGDPSAIVSTTEEAKNIALYLEKTLFFAFELVVVGDDRFIPLIINDALYFNIGWTFQKNSEFTEFFSYHLSKMNEVAILSRLSKYWTNRVSEEFGVSNAITLGYDNTMFPFCIFASGCLAAIFVGFCEWQIRCKPRPKGPLHRSNWVKIEIGGHLSQNRLELRGDPRPFRRLSC
jgi:hypothetical protein